MTTRWLDEMARRLAMRDVSRRGLAQASLGGALAVALGVAPEAAEAACRKPKKACRNGTRCCSGKCKKGKCAACNAASCTGCCDGGTCQPGTSHEVCGSAGATCQTCGIHQTCSSGCVNRRCPDGFCRVFLTSTAYNGNLGGLTGADALCQARAQAAGLPGTYMAWLSDSTASPATRFLLQSPDPYRLVNGTQIAANWAALTDGDLDAMIQVNEAGVVVDAGPTVTYTNTLADGTAGGSGVNAHCQNWSVASGAANSGRWTETGSAWTVGGWGSSYCEVSFRLYCFEQG